MRSGGSAAKRSGGWRNCGGDNAGFSGLAGGSFLALVGGMSAWSPAFPALVTSGEMRALEEAAVAAGRSEEALMDAASLALAQTVQEWLPRPGAAVVFAGKGHNAGDAFGLAGHLVEAGWRVEVRLAWPEGELRPLAARRGSWKNWPRAGWTGWRIRPISTRFAPVSEIAGVSWRS